MPAEPGVRDLRVLPVLAGINVLAWVAFGLAGHGWSGADSEALIRWGSNFGPLTKGGEPWRVLSYMALHSGILHLAVNTFTLLDFGRICEPLFGRSRFLALYLISGIAGGIASLWWNPMVNSVGASGAICGMLGALLAFTLDARNGIPVAALKSQLVGLGIFLAFSVAMSVGDAPIDHAAHFGGLAAGALAAVILTPWRRARGATLGATIVIAALAGLLYLAPGAAPGRLAEREAVRSFQIDLGAFTAREKELLERARTMVPNWPRPESLAGLRELAKHWDELHARFTAYRFEPSASQARLHELLIRYTDLRRRSYRALAELPQQSAPGEFERLGREIKQTVDEINALSRAR